MNINNNKDLVDIIIQMNINNNNDLLYIIITNEY
jgi:hypothetical protein